LAEALSTYQLVGIRHLKIQKAIWKRRVLEKPTVLIENHSRGKGKIQETLSVAIGSSEKSGEWR
jgi:hypothetical protein